MKVTLEKSNTSVLYCDYTICGCGFPYNEPAISKINEVCEYISLIRSNTSDIISIEFDLSGICSSENYLNKLSEIPSGQEELIHKKSEKVKTRVEDGIILFSQRR